MEYFIMAIMGLIAGCFCGYIKGFEHGKEKGFHEGLYWDQDIKVKVYGRKENQHGS